MESSNLLLGKDYVESSKDENRPKEYIPIENQLSTNKQDLRKNQIENKNNSQTDSDNQTEENYGYHNISFESDSHCKNYSSFEAYRNTRFKKNCGLFDGKIRDYDDENTSEFCLHNVEYIYSFHRTLAFINNILLLLHRMFRIISIRFKPCFFTFILVSLLQPGPCCLYSFAHAKSLSPLIEISENKSQSAVESVGVSEVNMDDSINEYNTDKGPSNSNRPTEAYTTGNGSFTDENPSKLHTRSVGEELTHKQNEASNEINTISVNSDASMKGTDHEKEDDAVLNTSVDTSMDESKNSSKENIDDIDNDDDDADDGEDKTVDENTNSSKGIIPEYMLKLYKKFTQKQYMHPASDTVRSFSNINEDILFNTTAKTELPGAVTRNHTLVFNISNFPKGEQINLAQLRLYKLVERDRNRYVGENRIVSLYEEVIKDDSPHLKLVSQKHIYGRNSGWESFDVTPAVKRWIDEIGKGYVQILQVTIESIFNNTWGDDMDISTAPRNKKEPLLVVFSKQINKRLVHKQERDEFLHHEIIVRKNEGTDNNNININNNNTSTSQSKKSQLGSTNYEYEDEEEEEEEEDDYVDEYDDEYGDGVNENNITTPEVTSYAKVRRSIRSDKNYVQPEKMRVKRSKKSARRNICKISKLEVEFRKIDGHDWVIAPKKYDANECIGKCYYPLAEHLQPTKHAMIRANLHIQNKKVTRPCCVPIKLEPISLLYKDATTQSYTFKYKYEGMSVSACGCR